MAVEETSGKSKYGKIGCIVAVVILIILMVLFFTGLLNYPKS